MKSWKLVCSIAAAMLLMTACKQVNFKKTKSGLAYKIFPGNGKDSLIKEGNSVKFNIVYKWNDSVIYDSHDKMPGFLRMESSPMNDYSIVEIMPMLRKGDSAYLVMMVDTLLNKGLASQLPPKAKKGDRMTMELKIVEVFKVDSLAQADYQKEMMKDAPRQQKEREAQMAKEVKEREEQTKIQDAELEKSGEKAKQLKVITDYFAKKGITGAQQAPLGTYVVIKQQGTGEQVADGKIAKVKYDGKRLATDSSFQASEADFQLGIGGFIRGMEEGLKLFKAGGKGTIYIPGYLAYGATPQPGSPFQPNDALIFDIEVVEVKDKPAGQ